MDVKHIMIVDDHPLVVSGFQLLIETEPDLDICCEAGAISEALALIAQRLPVSGLPDLAIVDLSLPDGSGLDLIRRMLAKYPSIRILVSSMHDELIFAERAIQAGAMGYINKHEASERIIQALRQVLDGNIYLSNKFRHRGIAVDSNTRQKSRVESPLGHLSNRELEVFGLIGHGLKTKEIAHKLHLSIKTIESYRSNIKSKLGLENASELVRSAIQWSLSST